MSLINDALKRARVAALQQEAEGGGVEYRAVPALARRDARPLIQLTGWVVAAVAIGLVLWLALRSPTAPVTPHEPPAAERVRPPVAASSTTDGGALRAGEAPPRQQEEALQAPTVSPPSPSLQATPLDATSSPATPPASIPRQPIERPAPVEPPTVGSAAGRAPVLSDEETSSVAGRAQGSVRLEQGATYLRRATSADGSDIELGGIAFSDERPIAVINGSVVSPGDMIAGFTVVGIEPERVELEAGGVRIYLSLH